MVNFTLPSPTHLEHVPLEQLTEDMRLGWIEPQDEPGVVVPDFARWDLENRVKPVTEEFLAEATPDSRYNHMVRSLAEIVRAGRVANAARGYVILQIMDRTDSSLAEIEAGYAAGSNSRDDDVLYKSSLEWFENESEKINFALSRWSWVNRDQDFVLGSTHLDDTLVDRIAEHARKHTVESSEYTDNVRGSGSRHRQNDYMPRSFGMRITEARDLLIELRPIQGIRSYTIDGVNNISVHYDEKSSEVTTAEAFILHDLLRSKEHPKYPCFPSPYQDEEIIDHLKATTLARPSRRSWFTSTH